MSHLWEMDTCWFSRHISDPVNSTFTYKNWNDFQECKPYKLWKPYILSSWSWKEIATPIAHTFEKTKRIHFVHSDHKVSSDSEEKIEMLQIVFLSPDRFSGVHRVEMPVQREEEELIRQWLKNHMPSFWKV